MTESNPGSVEPRTICGWTVPPHMHVKAAPFGVVHHLTCRHSSHEGGFPGRIVSPHDEDLPTAVGHWLRDHAHGVSVEYRPTPRQAECECFAVPQERWTTYFDATEPGSMLEPNPDCPLHGGPKGVQGCGAQSSWNGNHEIKYCARPAGHPGEHRSSLVSEWDTLRWDDDGEPVPAVSSPVSGENTTTPPPQADESVPAAQMPRAATNPGGLVSSGQDGFSSRVSSQARDELILAIAHPGGSERNLGPRPWECGPCERAERVADALLGAGWRPPQPQGATRADVPEMRAGMVDETWTVAIADGEGGWVTAGTWEPLTNAEVADWAEVGPAVDADELHLELYNRAVAAEGELALRSPVGPGLSREDLGRRVADVCVQWSREDDEREGATATWDALNSHRRELYMRVGEALFGLGMTLSPAPKVDTDLLGRFVAASLEFDYTAEGDCGGDYEDDEQEREAAIANVVEMHRLLNVRAERLAEAHEKLRALSSPLPDSETELPEGFSWQWGVKTAEGYFLPRRSEAEARKEVEDAVPGFYFLARHPVGPWKVVSE